ncbi:MAG: hypothetical protein HF967_10675, partial [Methanosarcinales archaeon]|nr:hypothetical protein [Methanosarcinales archaeon]
ILYFIILPTVCAVSVSLNPPRITVRADYLTEVRHIGITNPSTSAIRVNLVGDARGSEITFGSNNFILGGGNTKDVPITFKMGRGNFEGEIQLRITNANQNVNGLSPGIKIPIPVRIFATDAIPYPKQQAAQPQAANQQAAQPQAANQQSTQNNERKELTTDLTIPTPQGELSPIPSGMKQIPIKEELPTIKEKAPQNETNETNISYTPNQEIKSNEVNEIFGITHTQIIYGIIGILCIAVAAFAYNKFGSKINLPKINLTKIGKGNNNKALSKTQENTQPSANKKVWR